MDETLRNGVEEAYKKQGRDSFIRMDLLLLRRNDVTSFEKWKNLPAEEKNGYPYRLSEALDATLPVECK